SARQSRRSGVAPLRFQSPILAHIRHAALHSRAAEVRIAHRYRELPLVKEYRPNLEFAAVAHRKPYPVLEFLITDRKSQPLDVGPEEHFDGHRDLRREARLDEHGLEFHRVDQRLAFPCSFVEFLMGFGLELDAVHVRATILFAAEKLKSVLALLVFGER